jgi:gliding motility-associated-like protein
MVNSDSLVYSYEITTNQDCDDRITSRDHNNILVSTEFDDEDKKGAIITWNPYENWENGVEAYELFLMVDDGGFEPVGELSASQLSYNFISNDLGFEHCFKIRATESGNSQAYSWSNFSCITFIPELYPYNIITPNGDNKNDTFQIDNIEHYPNSRLTIINRWGRKIYETRGYDNTWGGMHNGEILPNSTYFYILELNEPRSDLQTINGMITILR